MQGRVILSAFGHSFGRHFKFVSIRGEFLFTGIGFPFSSTATRRKDAVCDAKLFASHITRYPYLYWNRHRSSTDSLYPRITSNCVPYPYWLKKGHSFHRNGNNARFAVFAARIPLPKSICEVTHPPKMSPFGLVSLGMAIVWITNSPLGCSAIWSE